MHALGCQGYLCMSIKITSFQRMHHGVSTTLIFHHLKEPFSVFSL
uniref:Uncharacterized protein n=1 Tax=Arundo donax TaxID=35708 RepID=A0A0A9AW90_ARUDO